MYEPKSKPFLPSISNYKCKHWFLSHLTAFRFTCHSLIIQKQNTEMQQKPYLSSSGTAQNLECETIKSKNPKDTAKTQKSRGSRNRWEVPLGPREVRVIADNCLQASMFLRTASSRPDKCLCPSFNIDCIPYGCIENPIVLSLFFYFLSNRK